MAKASRRRFSFELLPYESSGDAEIVSDKPGISIENGRDNVGKSHGRRRRNKGSKKNLVHLALAELDNGEYSALCDLSNWNVLTEKSPNSPFKSTGVSKISKLKKSASVADAGFFTECSAEPIKSGIPERSVAGNGRISEHGENYFLEFNNNNDEGSVINNQATDGDSLQSNGFRQDADANGVMHAVDIHQVHSLDSEIRNLDCSGEAQRSDANLSSNIENISNTYNSSFVEPCSTPELRQRTVNTITIEKVVVVDDTERNVDIRIVEEDHSGGTTPVIAKQQSEMSCHNARGTFGTPQALDWERLMAANSDYPLYVETSPLKYFFGEMKGGNTLRSTTSVGNENKRQKVYNTMFHVPWRCELLIDVGFFVCLDSFLSLLTIMPARILVFIWRCLNVRQFQRPCADELSDFGCLMVLICGVALLQITDISLIYHFIRSQGTIKLYVVYNMLEIFDKLCQSFGGDVLQVLFDSAEGVASCSREFMAFEMMRFILDEMIAVFAFIVHSFIILAQAITLSAAIISHNNALLALLVSNNFAEIKSNVFKRVSKENLHKMAYYDTVERFHIMAYILFVLAQNILEAESPWFWSFTTNACLVWCCEIIVDVIKHAFLAKFNEIKPAAYSEFLEALCKQTLNSQSHEVHKTLTFVPLAPACVVIRVLTPIYASHLPYGPFWWRWLWIILHFSVTYVMLATLKVMVGLCLQMHAGWYVRRCLRRKRHYHAD
eukprot:Gb_09240 [translate_table: standard]